MTSCFSSNVSQRLHARFKMLYGEDRADHCLSRLKMMIGRYGLLNEDEHPHALWDERDTLLITYGDMLQKSGEHPLHTLKTFADDRLRDAFRLIHILPFFPYSSDDGFSIIHYRNVNPDLGTWNDIDGLHEHFDLMFDLVLNHISRHSGWFRDYELGIAPARDYFIEVDPKIDLSSVVRPRSLPLLTRVHTRMGERYLWTTFSEDQIDLNAANSDVLFELLDILLFYVSQGARMIRLDAIAYLWKKIGTSCIHLPQTHEVVKIFRELLQLTAPEVILLTETNVPHRENISYFGNGDEAQMVYQFSLPPLLLHAALSGHARYLTDWADALGDPPHGCTFFNFTASHDGVGVRPLEGIVPDDELARLVEEVKQRGGQVSTRRLEDGTDKPYELNITYYDAMAFPGDESKDRQVARFLCTQAVPLVLRGVPAVYLNSLVGAPNDYALAEETGRARSLNRTKWDFDTLNAKLNDENSPNARVFNAYLHMLEIRRQHKAFHPDGPQRILRFDDRVFTVERTAPDDSERILTVSNLSGEPVVISAETLKTSGSPLGGEVNLLTGQPAARDGNLHLEPYEVAWVLFG